MKKIIDWLDWFFSEFASQPKVLAFMDTTLLIAQILTVVSIFYYFG